MSNLVKKKIILLLGAFMVLALAAAPGAWAGDKVAMPKTMVWSCYDVGSSGYMQASAIADAFGKKFGMRIRLLPSGTSIGRLMPLTANRVACGFLANEVYFAAEGLYDFATVQWGPQNLRVILAHPATIALATTKDSGIKVFKDLKGKRVSYIPGAPTLNVKMDAFLAFAGLTWNDVKKVEFPSYASSLKALIEGKTDASVTVTSASIMYELETSSRGLYWIPFDPKDKAAWKRMTKVAPFLAPAQETIGAGISPEKPVWLAEYRYPMITVYADKDPNWVYNMAKAMDESFGLYKDAHKVMPLWTIKKSGNPPADAPFHDGAIRYLKEKGVWTAEAQAWNDERVAHMKKLQAAWEKALEEKTAKKIKEKAFEDFWLKIRAEALAN
ncbi:MAG: TAXI family TRAP transporter solute-binding subunit [Desulfarculus sp.]|nr:TAXI family TRAP transporter solute-binding subunit [Pseudomonadota bacterium]MBV1716395.1 TAXI family TRAP transporter solute-binding subunit [Desulfarculus sp.]MBU4576178.1 TAXI family TRAP transporter solute-binding subunit [Pseudomonadota bacterium]MBU4598544.1 TAXI family TRAP transporter solute-binding subunit [Pseudomonadota bacterium]MBV1736879.1 TAXI family TRAP transporter solute-binding subunit [Desulfarculus sp.]